jgi:acetyl-CoA carboxylase carboxyltransferase component
VEIIYSEELKKAEDVGKKDELKDLYRDLFANPQRRQKGYIDDVIEPAGTRLRPDQGPEMLALPSALQPAQKTQQHPAVSRRANWT